MGQDQVGIVNIEISDMSGGLNSNTVSTQIEDRDAIDAQNVYYHDGFLRKMFGASRVNTTIGGAAATDDITGIYQYIQRDGDRFTLVTTSSDIFRLNGTSWTSIEGAFGMGDARHQFVTFNDVVIGTNLTNTPYTWNGAGNIAALGGTPPSARWITVFNNSVILANATVGGTAFPARVYYSAQGDHTVWDTTNDYLDMQTDDGDVVTGVRPLRNNLVVYKRDSISLVSSLSTPDLVITHDFKKGVGCVSGYTLVHARIFVNGVMREAHLFLGEDGVYAFDGSEVTRLSDKIKDFVKSLSQQRLDEAVGAYYKPLDQYYIFWSLSGSSTNNAGIIYDTRRGGFWPLTGINANAVGIVEDSSTSEDLLYFGDYISTVYQFDESNNGLEASTELITNGTMEADANWTSFGTPTTNDRSAVQIFNGSFSRRAITDAVSEGIYQDITTTVGQNYRVYAMVYVDTGDARARKQDTDGTDVVNGSTLSTAAFTRTTIDFAATATTSRIIFQSVAVAASTFFVDDVSVRRIDIDGYWDSKWFDLGNPQEMKILRELVGFFRTDGNYNVQARVRYDFETGEGSSSTINLAGPGDVYGTGVYDTALYGGSLQTFDDFESILQSNFRFIQIRFRNQRANEPFRIERFIIGAKPIGRRFVHNAA